MTLVEALVVVLLVALLALVGIDGLRTVKTRAELDAAARDVSAFLNSIPRHALDAHAPVFLVSDGGDGWRVSRTQDGASPITAFELPDPVELTGELGAVLRCDTMGRAFPGTSGVMLDSERSVELRHRAPGPGEAPHYVLTLSPLWAVRLDRVPG